MTATPKGVLKDFHIKHGCMRATRKQLVVAFVERGITAKTANRKIDELLDFGILFQIESTVPDGKEVYGCTWWNNAAIATKKIEEIRLTDHEIEIMKRKGLTEAIE